MSVIKLDPEGAAKAVAVKFETLCKLEDQIAAIAARYQGVARFADSLPEDVKSFLQDKGLI